MSTDNNTRTDSPFNIWWVVSGIGIVLVVVALILVLIFGRGGASDDNAAPAETTTSAPVSTETPDAAATTSCDLDDTNQDIPVSGPEAEWEAQTYLLVPTSREFGPSPLADSKWACFAHSPTGALFAAANVVAGAGGPEYEAFMPDAAVNNAALEAWIAGEDPATHTQSAGRVAQFSGFQMVSVQDDAVVVNLSITQGDVNAFIRVSMVWTSSVGTWNVDMATSDFDFEATDLQGFTPWGATDGS
jgi:hypothetical protein